MIRPASGLIVRFLAVAIAGLAVIAGFATWLALDGPITVDALSPFVVRALTGETGIAVTVDNTLVGLGADGKLDVLARGVHLSRLAGGARLNLSQLALGFSLRAALAGRIAPTRIVVSEPVLQLDRDADGAFHLGIGGADTVADDWGAQLLADLLHPPATGGTFSYLTEVAVQDAVLTVNDRSLGVEWRADRADVLLRRSGDDATGTFRLFAGQADTQTELSGNLRYRPEQQSLQADLSFRDLRPALWSKAAPALAGLAAFDLPVSGALAVDIDPTALTLHRVEANLRFGAGTVRQEKLPGGALAVTSGALTASYAAASGRIDVTRLALDLGGPTVEAAGSVAGLGADWPTGTLPPSLDLAGNFDIEKVPVDDFAKLWPEQLAVDTRNWVTQHIHDGTLDAAKAQFAVHLDFSPTAPKLAQVERFDGTLAYRDLSVEYFAPLAPVRRVDGSASFNRTEIDFTSTTGILDGIRVGKTSARFYKLDTHDEQGQIDLSAGGPLRDALAVLDTKPLGYANALGLDPKLIAGSFAAQAQFSLPLKRHLALSEVDFSSDATLSGVAVGKVIFDRDLTGGAFTMKLDRTALHLDGKARLDGVPMSLVWTQSLKPGEALPTHYAISTRLDDADRQHLGLDFLGDAVTGVVGVDLDYTQAAPHGRANANVRLDLREAAVAVPLLGLHKPPGTATTAALDLALDNDKPTVLRSATIAGGGLSAQLSARFTADGLSDVSVSHLVSGATDVSGSATRRAGGGWQIKLSGARFDATGLIDSLKPQRPAPQAGPPLLIEAKLGRLILGPKRALRTVDASLFSDGVHWRQAAITAKFTDPGGFSLHFGGGTGNRAFLLATDDFGALLRVFDVVDNISGGRFTLSGTAEDRGGKRVLVAQGDGADYRVERAPLLARFLSIGSLSGIAALLSGDGIPFSRLSGDIVYGEDGIALNNVRAYGGAIGVNLHGTLDRVAETLDISGTVVPAYLLNSILGNIPILGNLLLGGEGQGIFGVNFRVAGGLDDPKISINPLSALAPGFLRRLFLFAPGDPSDDKPVAASPVPP